MYRYCSTLEDSIKKSAFVPALDRYRNTNEYQRKAKEIEDSYQTLQNVEDLLKYGMGKQALKIVLKWLNEDCKVQISQRDLLGVMELEDIPTEISQLFIELSQKRNIKQ